MRIGMGYDVHRLVKDRPLIVGGIDIPYEKGLLGHSDADVLTHAIMDAIIGAMGMGDIGKFFPDTDPAYENISSLVLLERVCETMKSNRYTLVNLDATLIAQKPKFLPHLEAMKDVLSNVLKCELSQINIKATTTEKLGFEGREEGIAAQAVVLMNRMED